METVKLQGAFRRIVLPISGLYVLAALSFCSGGGGGGGNTITPSGSFVIDNGAAYTADSSVVLDISVSDADEMRFSNDEVMWSEWEPYNAAKPWTIQDGHESKIVYGEFRKNGGGVAGLSDTIIPLVEEKIVAPDPSASAYFGGGHWNFTAANLAISSDGNTWITTSALKNTVYVYRKIEGGWNETIITSADATGAVYFGNSIACTPDASIIVIGALSKPAIYVYRLDGSSYVLEKKIDSPTPTILNDFAVTVSVSDNGNIIIVGSWNPNGNGRAYLYKKTGVDWNTFIYETFSASSDAFAGDRYGVGVKISGDGNTFVVGSVFMDSLKGAIYIYRWNGSNWGVIKKTASDGNVSDLLGRHIGVSNDGNKIIAGTRAWSNGNLNQGAAYLFEWDGNTFIETKKFFASDGAPDDKFGYCVSMSSDGNTVVISAPGNQLAHPELKGKMYVYKNNGSAWNEECILMASDGSGGDFYGNLVAISGDASIIMVSAPMDDTGSIAEHGSMYLY